MLLQSESVHFDDHDFKFDLHQLQCMSDCCSSSDEFSDFRMIEMGFPYQLLYPVNTNPFVHRAYCATT